VREEGKEKERLKIEREMGMAERKEN